MYTSDSFGTTHMYEFRHANYENHTHNDQKLNFYNENNKKYNF